MQRNKGFTLIEVLIALAILAIAFTAIIRAVDNNTHNLNLLERHAIAHWVAMDTIASAQLGLIAIPSIDNDEQGEDISLGKTWYWQLTRTKTQEKNIDKLSVSVKSKANANPITTISGFYYEKK